MEYAGERRESQLRGRQGRLAFAYLVLHRDRPVRRDALIEALWAHEGAPPSDTALAPVLSRLRRAIEPATLEGRDTLRLVFDEPVWVDVEAIAELAALRRPRGGAGSRHARRARAAAGRRRAVARPVARRPRGAAGRGAGDRRARPQRAARGRTRRPCRDRRGALPRVLARRADLGPRRARQPRRGRAGLRRVPRAAARGAGDGSRARAGRAARAPARSRPGPAGAGRPARARRRSWPRSPPRWRG